MNIVKALENTGSCIRFNQLIKKAKSDITFWGWRHVCIPYRGKIEKIPIEMLIKRVRDLANAKNFDFIPEERAQGKILVAKINALYVESDQVLKSAFFITRIICAVREFFKQRTEKKVLGMITYRTLWEVWENKTFDFYKPAEFQKKYGLTFNEAIRSGINVAFAHHPTRYRIVEPEEPFTDSVGNII